MKMRQKLKIILACLLATQIVQASTDIQSILKIKVTEEGIYRVNFSDMSALGLTALNGVNNSSLSLTNNGVPVPIKVVSNDNSTFGRNAYIEFIGHPDNSLYQEGSVYNLEINQANGVYISDSSIQPVMNQPTQGYYLHTDYYDKNPDTSAPAYTYSYGTPIDDPWFAKMLATPSGLTDIFDFDIDHLVQQASVNFEVNVWGGLDFPQSTTDHHLTYTLNGTTLDRFSFDGLDSEIRNYTLDSTSLTSGSQSFELTIANPNDTGTFYDIIHIESWKVTYPREFFLNNDRIDFNKTLDETSSNADILFSNGFENSLRHYQIQNATSAEYRIYVENNNNVELITYNKSGNCSEVASSNCLINFSTHQSQGHVYIESETVLHEAELSLPTILEDINQGGFDFLIITHPDFIGNALDEFILQKQTQGHVIKVVDIEQIYARFGYGNVSAQSIAQYIKSISETVQINNVLLVGGDTYDYKGYGTSRSISFIPTLYAQTDSLITYAPVDAKFVDLNFDNIPDISIGRFPVRSENELSNLVNKLKAYKSKNYAKTSMFVADKFDESNNYNFKNDAELFVSQLPISWQINIEPSNKVYLDDDPSIIGIAIAKNKIIDNINQGVALTSFFGHSSPTSWSKSRMFQAADASGLTNASNPTIITQWGCWNTYFVEPEENTLAHAFMLNQNGGAATVLGASTLTKAAHERGLAELVLNNLTHGEMTIGEAVTLAKQTYAQINPEAVDVILGWTILGDPSLKL